MDKTAIIHDLKARQLTQIQIAIKHSVSQGTVCRLAKKHNLQFGQGRRPSSYWSFKASPDLAYLIGIYITDGWLSCNHTTRKWNQVSIVTTTDAITIRTKEAILGIGLKPRVARRTPNGKGSKLQTIITIYHTVFATWLHDTCNRKAQIPSYLFDAPIAHKLEFLAGVIDGDGSVSKAGYIKVNGSYHWITQLPAFIGCAGIRTPKLNTVCILASGKPYYQLSINRSDYLALGGTTYHPQKKERITHGKETRTDRVRKKYFYPCPICSQMTMRNRDGQSCRACYLVSGRHLAHCRSIAKQGNLAANKARWGH